MRKYDRGWSKEDKAIEAAWHAINDPVPAPAPTVPPEVKAEWLRAYREAEASGASPRDCAIAASEAQHCALVRAKRG